MVVVDEDPPVVFTDARVDEACPVRVAHRGDGYEVGEAFADAVHHLDRVLDQRAMREDEQIGVGTGAVRPVTQRVPATGAGVRVGFGVVAHFTAQTVRPQVEIVGERGTQFVHGHALPVAEVPFTQPFVDVHVESERVSEGVCALLCALEVGGDDELACGGFGRDVQVTQRPAGLAHLPSARRVEWDVDPSLDAAGLVVRGAPVPHERDRTDLHAQRSVDCGSSGCSRGSSICGQSRHRRSRW